LALNIIDTHAHLDMPEFNPDREQVITRAFENGVTAIVTIGINLESNRRAIDLAEKHPGIWAGIGIHPQDSKGVLKSDVEQLAEMASNPRVVAIGETGLDYLRDFSPQQDQLQVLNWELAVAKKVGLPVIIHCRQAQDVIIPILRDWSSSYPLPADKPRGVLHNFRDDLDTAKQYMAMGFYFSLGAYLGYPSSARLRAVVGELPLDRLLIETDCPFLPPQEYRGRRNEPGYTTITVRKLAEIKGITAEEAARQTTINAQKVFNLPRS
jgi:TatD DNase family protein